MQPSQASKTCSGEIAAPCSFQGAVPDRQLLAERTERTRDAESRCGMVDASASYSEVTRPEALAATWTDVQYTKRVQATVSSIGGIALRRRGHRRSGERSRSTTRFCRVCAGREGEKRVERGRKTLFGRSRRGGRESGIAVVLHW